MSESDELKKQADIQKQTQQYEALNTYINTITKRLEDESKEVSEAMRLGLYSLVLYVVVCVTSFFVSGPLMLAALLAGVTLTWILMQRVSNKIHKAERTISEIDGCFNTLEILGFLESGWRGRNRRKQKVSAIELAWAKAKTVARWRPYSQPVANGAV